MTCSSTSRSVSAGSAAASSGVVVPERAAAVEKRVAMDYVLVAPAAGTEHLDWMRATRALDVAISTSDPRAPKQGRAG